MFQMAGAELLVRCLWRRWERQAQLQEAAGGAAAARLEPCASDMELGSAGKDAPAPAPAPAPAEPGAEAVVAAGAAAAGCAAAVAAGVRTLRRRWRYRKLQRHGAHGMALEAAICCMRSLSPLMGAPPAAALSRSASCPPPSAACGAAVQAWRDDVRCLLAALPLPLPLLAPACSPCCWPHVRHAAGGLPACPQSHAARFW